MLARGAMSWTDNLTQRVWGTQVGVGTGAQQLALHHQSLVVVAGPNRGLRREVDNPTVRIGTASSCDLVLEDDTVSRHHCEITVREEGYVLRDLGSTNGTRVNGLYVVEAIIEPGAHLELGETTVLFEGHRTWLPVPESREPQFGGLYGGSQAMRAVFGVLEKVSPTMLSVLLFGETGSGKDLAARGLHASSARGQGPFVVVDCGALQPNLVESQLFGHVRGAFTGAEKDRKGAFERAHGGTVFLDEIGELPLELQPRLLRVLERHEVEPLGGSDPIDVDVRVVAATHRDLAQMVDDGTFREDLYYRLAEVIVHLPPLRERLEDLPVLAERLLADADPTGRVRRFTPDAIEWLRRHEWTGNVRELRNTIRRAAVMTQGDSVSRDLLEALERMSPKRASRAPPPPSAPAPAAGRSSDAVPLEIADHLAIKEAREHWVSVMEKRYLERMLTRFGDDIGAIAAHMNLHRKSVFRLLRQHGLMEEE